MDVLQGQNWLCVLVLRFLGLNIGNFGISSEESRTMLSLVLIPGPMSLGFVEFFGITVIC